MGLVFQMGLSKTAQMIALVLATQPTKRKNKKTGKRTNRTTVVSHTRF